MFGIKYLRIRRIERTRKKREEKTKEEEKKLKEKHEQEKYEKELDRLKQKAPEYVLTISASAYVESVGKKLTDYNFRIISVRSGYGGYENYRTYEGCLERMTREGERINAEIIVDVRFAEDESYHYQRGTALIPKKKKQ